MVVLKKSKKFSNVGKKKTMKKNINKKRKTMIVGGDPNAKAAAKAAKAAKAAMASADAANKARAKAAAAAADAANKARAKAAAAARPLSISDLIKKAVGPLPETGKASRLYSAPVKPMSKEQVSKLIRDQAREAWENGPGEKHYYPGQY